MTITIPTKILFDEEISYIAKGLYCYIFARNKNSTGTIPKNVNQEKNLNKAFTELMRAGYVQVKDKNVYFLK
jgi:hypothetical protein